MRYLCILTIGFILILATKNLQSKPYQIVLLGSSLLSQANWSELLGRDDIYYFSQGGSLSGNIRKYAATVASMNPKICFVMADISDFLEKVAVYQVYQNIAGTVAELQVNGIIPVVVLTLHVNDKYWSAYQLNPKIKDLNKLLLHYCRSNEIDYIDLNPLLAPDNQLLERFSPDGLRLNAQAYRIWADKLGEILQKYNL